MVDILNKTYDELLDYVESLGEPRYRGKQLWHWLWSRRVRTFADMHTLSRQLIAKLSLQARIFHPEVIYREQSIDGTIKLVVSFEDGSQVETVLIPTEGKNGSTRVTQCISTQVGCAMGCRFCSTGEMGFHRNLSMREIVSQVLLGKAEYEDTRNSHPIVRNIVFMGMGEPFLNYNEVIRSLRVLGHEEGLGFSKNKITVSTCGIVDKIREYSKEDLGTLAVSLHGTTQEQREQIMPQASRYSIEELLEAMEEYTSISGRYITLEYVLLSGVNDSISDAKRLGAIAHRLRAKVNILCYNESIHSRFLGSSSSRLEEFSSTIRSMGIVSVVRKSRGKDISAACGQLIVGNKEKLK